MKDIALSSDGIPVCYEVHGTGAPALVLVHGWSCDRSYWSRQIGYFAGRYRVVAIDLAGHAESGAGRPAWTMPAFGNDVVAVVEKLGLEELVLIGHSMGGDVIVETALRLPGRAVGLVWADTYSSLGEPRTREQIQQFTDRFVRTSSQQLVASFEECSCPHRMPPWSIGWPPTCLLPLRRSRSTLWNMPSATIEPSFLAYKS